VLTVVEDDLRAVSFRRGALDGGCICGHDDDAGNVEKLSGQRHGLCMIPGREGDDAAAAFVEREPRQRVVGAAELEGARALEVLALEEDPAAGALVNRVRGDNRRAMSDACELPGCELDVGEGRKTRLEARGSRDVLILDRDAERHRGPHRLERDRLFPRPPTPIVLTESGRDLENHRADSHRARPRLEAGWKR